LSAGIAAGADAICLPEEPTDLEALAKAIRRRHDAGASSSVVVVAEGAHFAGPTGGAVSDRGPGATVADALTVLTGYETRLTVLGHVQRGGTPVPTDRLLAASFGVEAMRAVHERRFSTLVSTSDDTSELVPLEVVMAGPRPVPAHLLAVARALTVR
jgi:6-phosphofructokinase 1